ncbi:MAG: MBL fold metallo-hydrolase [Candidatus Bathyarchaeota archaeon]
MSQINKVENIKKLFALQLKKEELAFIYLGFSGIIFRTSTKAIMIDPANSLKNEDIKHLDGIDLVLFTHNHGDHYSLIETLEIFKTTGAPILAESLVAENLKGKIPVEKLTSAILGTAFTLHDITVKVIQGIHRGPICLYQIQIGDLSIFHGGDSGYVTVKDYPSNLAFLPMGSPSPTASPDNAFKMAADIKPSIVVVIHGSLEQSKEFAAKIKNNIPNMTVIIPEPYALKIITL